MNNQAKDALKQQAEPLMKALSGAGAKFKGRTCNCPFCDDKHPSAGVFQKDGLWYFKCHKCGFGGDIVDVLARIQNSTPADVLRGMDSGRRTPGPSRGTSRPHVEQEDDCPPPMPAAPEQPKTFSSLEAAKSGLYGLQASYVYTNPVTNKPEMYVFRIQPAGQSKRFLQGRPGETAGEIVLQAPAKPWPLYNRKRIADSSHVVCVEGEKAVHALTDVLAGLLVATTSPGGAGKAEHADWSPLAGKHVYLWPDNDPPNDKGERTGIRHMRQVQKILEELDPPPILYWIDPDSLDLPPKGDAVEFLARFPDAPTCVEQVGAVMANAEPLGASAGVKARIEDEIAGRRETIALPWKEIHSNTHALKPGTVTILCGDGGAAKSLCLLQLCQYWHFELGHKIALYALEDDREYHLRRALAQKTGEVGLMNEEWVKDNPEKARQLFRDNAEFLDRMGRLIYEAPTEAVHIVRLAKWVEEQAESGKRIICIDPITAAATGKESWIQDQAFLIAVKKAIVEHECSLVLVTHPKKGGGRAVGMDNLAGGACWSRFSQTILWMKNPNEEKRVQVLSHGMTTDVECNRIMAVLKARNSTGGGCNFAMRLEGLKLSELGSIVKKKKGQEQPVF